MSTLNFLLYSLKHAIKYLFISKTLVNRWSNSLSKAII